MKPKKVEVTKVANGYMISPIFSAAMATAEELQVVEEIGASVDVIERLGDRVIEMLNTEYKPPEKT